MQLNNFNKDILELQISRNFYRLSCLEQFLFLEFFSLVWLQLTQLIVGYIIRNLIQEQLIINRIQQQKMIHFLLFSCFLLNSKIFFNQFLRISLQQQQLINMGCTNPTKITIKQQKTNDTLANQATSGRIKNKDEFKMSQSPIDKKNLSHIQSNLLSKIHQNGSNKLFNNQRIYKSKIDVDNSQINAQTQRIPGVISEIDQQFGSLTKVNVAPASVLAQSQPPKSIIQNIGNKDTTDLRQLVKFEGQHQEDIPQKIMNNKIIVNVPLSVNF